MSKQNNSFLKNALMLVGSNTLSQIIAIVASIILARIYSPEEMGMYTNFVSINAILVVIGCMQYERSIVIVENEEKYNIVLKICFFIVLGWTLLVAVASTLLRGEIASILNIAELRQWIILLPFATISVCLMNIMLYSNMRKNTMKNVVFSNLIAAGMGSALQMVFGFSSNHLFGGMVLGWILGNAIAAIYNCIKTDWDIKAVFRKQGKEPVLQVMKEQKQFPLFAVPSTLLDTVGASAPSLMISTFFGGTITGLYALSYRVLSLPISVISSAVSQAFLPQAVISNREGSLPETTKEVFAKLICLGGAPLLLIAFCMPELNGIVFGDRWIPAGYYGRWLCIWLLWGLLYAPLSNIFIVVEKQQIAMVFNSVALVVKLSSLLVGGLLKNDMLAISLCSICSALTYCIGCCIVFHLVHVNLTEVIRIFLTELFKLCPFLVPSLVVVVISDNAYIKVLICVMCGVIFLLTKGKALVEIIKSRK